ncbi:unnamed protein product [Phaedon cochleariae]|uniref:Soluble interferon alpha/beta receptor OPG204 n=1 Tax=Phaedon cochleariae TaxID=80249 RepID=A0A9P0DID4_PHACE|nr:unnamed protein product [Phaedon cochleariae]
MGVREFFFCFLAFVCCFVDVFSIEDYCSRNNFNSSDKFMHFTKEATFEEFAVVGKFKGLHCCAKGYRSIEWYKDDRLYPWALEISSLILVPESGNQTIYSQSLSEKDGGNYTCVLRNDTVLHSHTIHFRVFDKVPDEPKITYISRDTSVHVGDSLRLFCEAFAGQVDLPDAHSEAYWKKIGANNTVHNVPDVNQLKEDREVGQIFGTYLTIDEVKREDFGTYVCTITKPGKTIDRYVTVSEKVDEVEYLNPNPVPLAKLALLLSAILLATSTLALLYLKYGLEMRVRLKDAFGADERRDGKRDDVLLLSAPDDSDLALGVLAAALDGRYRYRCAAKVVTSDVGMWYTDLKDDALRCRRIIAVLSPALFKGDWQSSSLLEAINQLKSLGPPLICVSLKELPKSENETKNAQGETLTTLARSVGVILWERKSDDAFWYSLRLRLPARRRSDEDNTRSDQSERLSTNGQECLDNLV